MRHFARIAVMLTALSLSTLVLAQEQDVRIFAHRGGRQEQDENTMNGFKGSFERGYRGFETDVHFTKDHALIITHDSNLERMTGQKVIVEEKTEAELRKVRTLKGNPIPFLSDVLDFFQDKSGLYIEFEMKTTDTSLYPDELIPEYCEKVYAAVMAQKPKDATYLFTSFDYRPLRYLRQHHPDADLLLISSDPCSEKMIALCKAMDIKRMGVGIQGTSRSAVEAAHKAGLTVSLWPGNKVEDTILGIYLGADFLCTDVPYQVKTYLDAKMPWLHTIY